MAEAQEQALGIFADAVLKLALHLQREALDAEDLDQKVRAAGAVHRLGRGLRQTLALQAKLARDARSDAVAAPEAQASMPLRAEAPAPPDLKTVAVRRRCDWLTRGVERCVWNEHDREEEAGAFTGDSLLEDLRERLADLMADPDAFLSLDPDEVLVRLCQDLGVAPPQFHPPAPAVPAAFATAATNGHDSS
ncbi:MAG: hypothetical protein ACHP9T_00825 [Caulobacterales bacterium]